jgi:hypothetical protein
MALISLILSVCALCFCVYLYLESQKKLSSEDVASKLAQASDELSKTYGKQFREIETEWIDMYEKFKRLAGRVDKVRGLEAPPAPTTEPAQFVRPPSRSDLIRGRNLGGANK